MLVAHDATHRPVAVVGRDPRASGEMLEAAVVAGLTAAGADVSARRRAADPGRRVPDRRTTAPTSASCCPPRTTRCRTTGSSCSPRGGHKLADDDRGRDRGRGRARPDTRPIGAAVGRLRDAADAAERYSRTCSARVPPRLDGLHVVVDCAHGAASVVAPELYRARGRAGHRDRRRPGRPEHQRRRRVDAPRRCLRAAVRASGADLGIAHDGDADRCLAVDANGAVVDGDQILASVRCRLRDAGGCATTPWSPPS